MGTIYSHIQRPINAATQIITGRKRKRDDDDYDCYNEVNNALELSLNTPKRKKLVTTAQYIYQALFKEERNYDISVMALGKIWHLHKVYLCQSPYFASMFSGSWRESQQNFINIEIVDSKITLDALTIVFGSLYLDEVVFEPLQVVNILATSALFQLDGLLEKCTEVMNETINAETAVMYYEAASQYGIPAVKKTTFNWLLVNLMSLYSKNTKWLRTINIDLMHIIISSPDLYVMPTEFSLYILIKFWVFLKLNPNYELNEKNDSKDDQMLFFSKRNDGEEKLTFVETKFGKPYEIVFKSLRIEHLMNHHLDLMKLLADRIIPQNWLNYPLFYQWSSMLRVDEALDNGPKECDEKLFYDNCFRCGRVLSDDGFQKWRWNGFNFGLDLVLTQESQVLSIKRHHRTENERLLSLQVKRKFLIRVTVASLNELRQIKHSQTTGVKLITLDKNEDTKLLQIDDTHTYPLLISVNFLVVSRNKEIETIKSDTFNIENNNNCNLSLTNNNNNNNTFTNTNSNNNINNINNNSCNSSSSSNNMNISSLNRNSSTNNNNITSCDDN